MMIASDRVKKSFKVVELGSRLASTSYSMQQSRHLNMIHNGDVQLLHRLAAW